MRANDILSDQVIHVKRGKQNGFGFEPLWNSYFDFYLDSRYFEEPLLELEDVTFHLFLRKNLNDNNKQWKMPTIRQISKKFHISNYKIYAMLERLAKAHLLNKESGVKEGEATVRNDYILSDPISTLAEFLEVAQEELFRFPLLPGYRTAPAPVQAETMDPCFNFRNTGVAVTETSGVSISETDQQTSNTKHTVENSFDPAFEELRVSLSEQTFNRFLNGAKLVSIEEGIAVIGTPHNYAKDFIENRLVNKLKYALKVDGVRCVVLTD